MPYRVTKLKVFAAGFAKIVQYNDDLMRAIVQYLRVVNYKPSSFSIWRSASTDVFFFFLFFLYLPPSFVIFFKHSATCREEAC